MRGPASSSESRLRGSGSPIFCPSSQGLRVRPEFAQRPVILAARGVLTVPALFAAALEPAIGSLYLAEGLISFRSIVETEVYQYPLGNFVPNLLAHTDLPELSISLAPRRSHARRRDRRSRQSAGARGGPGGVLLDVEHSGPAGARMEPSRYSLGLSAGESPRALAAGQQQALFFSESRPSRVSPAQQWNAVSWISRARVELGRSVADAHTHELASGCACRPQLHLVCAITNDDHTVFMVLMKLTASFLLYCL